MDSLLQIQHAPEVLGLWRGENVIIPAVETSVVSAIRIAELCQSPTMDTQLKEPMPRSLS